MDSIRSLSDNDLIHAYGTVIDELKQRKIIRSKNVLGDLGEYLANKYYCETLCDQVGILRNLSCSVKYNPFEVRM